MNIIISKGKAVGIFNNTTAPYDESKDNVYMVDKRNRFSIDNISTKDNGDKKNIILNPGMLMNYETNLFPAYPQFDIPNSNSTSWIGGIYE